MYVFYPNCPFKGEISVGDYVVFACAEKDIPQFALKTIGYVTKIEPNGSLVAVMLKWPQEACDFSTDGSGINLNAKSVRLTLSKDNPGEKEIAFNRELIFYAGKCEDYNHHIFMQKFKGSIFDKSN